MTRKPRDILVLLEHGPVPAEAGSAEPVERPEATVVAEVAAMELLEETVEHIVAAEAEVYLLRVAMLVTLVKVRMVRSAVAAAAVETAAALVAPASSSSFTR